MKRRLHDKTNDNRRYFIIGLISFTGTMVVLILIAWTLHTYSEYERSKMPVLYSKKKELTVRPPDITTAPEATLSAKLRIPIIMYHYVEYVRDSGDTIRKKLDINPYIFEAQIRQFEEGKYELHFVRDIPQILDGQMNASTMSAVLTFDDGYEDFYTNVFPLLKKYKAKATIYVIYDFIGRRGFLTADQIKEILKSGLVELGSHTLDHVYLKRANPSVASHQIVDSKQLLEKEFGTRVSTFAYPNGTFDQATLDMVKGASYSAAVSEIPGTIQSKENLLFLSRLRPGYIEGQNVVRVIQNYPK